MKLKYLYILFWRQQVATESLKIDLERQMKQHRKANQEDRVPTRYDGIGA